MALERYKMNVFRKSESSKRQAGDSKCTVVFIYIATSSCYIFVGAVNLPGKEIWSKFAHVLLAVLAQDRRAIYDR